MNTEPASLNFESGVKLAGVYLLQRALETGPGAAIWLAEDEVLGKTVALHFLPKEVVGDARALAEIRLEVKRTRTLIHPNILRVYDLVENATWAAVATDAFDGRRLSAVLAEHGRYEVDEVEDWLDQVCMALEEAHRVKYTHRDLDPENVFVTADGRLLLGNFGIGRAILNSLQRAGKLPAESSRWSSASPQLLDGAAPTPSDDVYGIGSLFFRLLTGDPVFSGGNVPVKIREEIAPRISDVRSESADAGEPVSPGWENVIAACLNKNHDERPGRPAEIVSSIQAYGPPDAEPAVSAAVPAPAPAAPILTLVPSVSEPAHIPEVPAAQDLADEVTADAPAQISAGAEEPVEATVESPANALATNDERPLETEIEAVPAPEIPAEEVTGLTAAGPAEPVESAAADAALGSKAEAEDAAKTAPEKSEKTIVTPRLYDTDEDAFSSILPKRFRFPAAVAAAVIVVIALINGGSKNEKEKSPNARPIATSDPADRGELTPVKNSARETSAAPAPEKTSPIESPARDLASATNPGNRAGDEPILLAASTKSQKKSPTPTPAPAPVAAPDAAAPSPDSQGADKAAAIEKLKADLATLDQEQQAKLKEKQAAEAAAADAEKAIETKSKAAAAAKKETQELTNLRKQREDERKAAELAAQAAQQLAAEKLKAADDARKSFDDFEAKNREKLSAQDKIDAELQTLQRTVAEQRKAAEESARAAAAAAAARQQRAAAIQQAEQDLANSRAAAAKLAEEAQRKGAVDSERKKLDDEISAMRTLFEQKMKDIEDRRRQLESPAAAPSPAPAALVPTAPPAAAVPVPATPRPTALATPAPALPLMAARTEPPPVQMPVATPAPPVAPAAVTSGGSTNSLGLRFVPVGESQFSVWLTRWKDFDAYARSVNLKSTAWRGPGFRQGPDHPVVNVTWNEAIGFCKWLTDKEHKEGTLPANQFYRLPYDLEWSQAVGLPAETGKTPEARDMGVPDVYPWGTDWPPPKGAGNYTGEETGSDVAIKGYDDGFAWTSPVGSFPPNKLGLYDMGGNVWQWCMDTWNADSKARVLRGASWYNGALKLSLLASCRVHATPDSSTDNYGFRIVRATEAASAKPARR